MNGYYLMALLYFWLGVVAMAGSALITFGVLPATNGLRWLQIHFITLGVLTQVLFGALPALVASRAGKPEPRMSWGLWLILNAGLIALLVAIPLVNQAMILAGGTLVLAATLLLLRQLVQLRSPQGIKAVHGQNCGGTRFYAAGLVYLLLGAFLGTGLYLGWAQWLHLPAIKEVHVHSNLWGFTALIFAGLVVDLPVWASGGNSSHLQGRWLNGVFFLMTAGALGLALGPWLGSGPLQAGGLVLHVLGTAWLLVGMARQIKKSRAGWSAGRLHILAAFGWLLLVAVLGPVVVFLPQSDLARTTASQGSPLLIYGWLLQFVLAILPYLYSRSFTPGRTAVLGGNRLSLLAVNAGALLYLAGLIAPGSATALRGLAFAAWAAAMLPVAIQLWRSVQLGSERGALQYEAVKSEMATER